MTLKSRELLVPRLRSDVSVAPETFSESDRTVEVRFYSGASVQRYPLFDEPYELAFSLDAKSVRLDRFNAGAPLIDNHRDGGSVSDVVLGVVQRAWLAPDGGHALVKFSARDEVTSIIADVRDGILRNFSMGAVVHKMTDVTQNGDTQRRLLAVDWTPMELSIVPVPADPGAQALASAERFPCQLLTGASAPTKGVQMDQIKVRLLATGEVIDIDEHDYDEKLHSQDIAEPKPSKGNRAAELAAAKKFVDEEIAYKRAYGEEVERLGREFDMDEMWIERHKRLGTPLLEVKKLATKMERERAPQIGGGFGLQLGDERESLPWRVERMAEAIGARVERKAPPEAARQYARFTIAEMAREILMLHGRTYEVSHLNPSNRADAAQLIKLGTHTPSDFPKLLNNVLNKGLLPAYELANPSYKQIAAERTFNDFRAHHFLRPGDFPVPQQVGPGGEYQSGTMSENDEQVTAYKYGVIYPIAFETLANDDVSVFGQIAGWAGQRAADFENSTFYSTCITAGSGLGPTLSDSVAVYDATHGNIATTGALSITVLDSIRALMMAQTSLDGLKLNITPEVLLTSPASAGLAERLLAPQSSLLATATTADTNNWAGRLRPIADANLTGTRVYAFANPNRHPNYIYGGLAGESGPTFETQQGFDVDAVRFKLRIVFGCGAVDYKGGVTAAGA